MFRSSWPTPPRIKKLWKRSGGALAPAVLTFSRSLLGCGNLSSHTPYHESANGSAPESLRVAEERHLTCRRDPKSTSECSYMQKYPRNVKQNFGGALGNVLELFARLSKTHGLYFFTSIRSLRSRSCRAHCERAMTNPQEHDLIDDWNQVDPQRCCTKRPVKLNDESLRDELQSLRHVGRRRGLRNPHLLQAQRLALVCKAVENLPSISATTAGPHAANQRLQAGKSRCRPAIPYHQSESCAAPVAGGFPLKWRLPDPPR